MTPRVGVLLLNLGGPDTLADVRPFLVNLFSDRDIIQLPLGGLIQPLFARALAAARAPSVRRHYADMGGGSPQLRLTREQADAVGAALASRGVDVLVRVGMRYWRPSLHDALADFVAAGVARIVVLPLYPQYSLATTGSSLNELARVRAADPRLAALTITVIESYADDPTYLDALAATVRESLTSWAATRRDQVVVLFSAHGLPQSFVDRGDPYIQQIHQTVSGVWTRLGIRNRHVVAFQSRTGPVKWVDPAVEPVLTQLGQEGVSDVLIVPVSFVSDHIETLYEVDQLFAGLARAAGITTVARSRALNADPVFIDALAGLVTRHLDGVR